MKANLANCGRYPLLATNSALCLLAAAGVGVVCSHLVTQWAALRKEDSEQYFLSIPVTVVEERQKHTAFLSNALLAATFASVVVCVGLMVTCFQLCFLCKSSPPSQLCPFSIARRYRDALYDEMENRKEHASLGNSQFRIEPTIPRGIGLRLKDATSMPFPTSWNVARRSSSRRSGHRRKQRLRLRQREYGPEVNMLEE